VRFSRDPQRPLEQPLSLDIALQSEKRPLHMREVINRLANRPLPGGNNRPAGDDEHGTFCRSEPAVARPRVEVAMLH
jgi:hypothetical protein